MTAVLVCTSPDDGIGAGSDLEANTEVLNLEHLLGRQGLVSLLVLVFDAPLVVLIYHLKEGLLVSLLLVHVGCEF